MKQLTAEQKLRKIIREEIKKMRIESKFDFDRLNSLDPIKNFNTKNFKLVRFAFNDDGDNATALLDLKNKKIISYSLTGKSEVDKFNSMSGEIKKESISGEVVFSVDGTDNSIIKITELPDGIIQVYKDGNRTNWKAVRDLVNPKDRKEISNYILSGENKK